jgi:protein-serine/threonine kinase
MSGHGFAVDWWTFGVLIYEMITGRPPFMNKNHHKLGILIRQGQIIFPDPVRHGIPMSEEIKDLIVRLLDKNPKTRIGSLGDADEIV